MLNFFDKLYDSIIDKTSLGVQLRFYSMQRYIVRTLANLIIPTYFKITSNNSKFCLTNSKSETPRIIISLTSFPTRISKVWLVIETILRQTEKPDLIILWLSKDQFSSLDNLPKRLLKLQNRGLKIKLKEGDLRSHKKYYYTVYHFPNDIMITIDDDIFYPTNMISELMKYHDKFPSSIIARYGSKIKVENENILAYKTWDSNCDQSFPDFKTFFGSGGGVLFPPGSLPAETLNKVLFMKFCLYADDIWLNTMCRLNNRKIMKTKLGGCSLLPIIHKNNIYLHRKNLGENLNDVQLKNVRNYYISNGKNDPYFEILHSRV